MSCLFEHFWQPLNKFEILGAWAHEGRQQFTGPRPEEDESLEVSDAWLEESFPVLLFPDNEEKDCDAVALEGPAPFFGLDENFFFINSLRFIGWDAVLLMGIS